MSLACVCLVVTPSQFEERKAFYTTVLSILGYKEWRSGDNFIGLANPAGVPDFFLTAKEESERQPTKNVHIGFKVSDHETVQKFHAAGL
jgi:catechol 2,3-dioxygenase-like lactoylglutathione lyase family enzyme